MSKRCPFGSIPCNNNVGCYRLEDLCDGETACQDGTDEIAMDCGHTTGTSPLPTNPTACSTEATCPNFDGVKICLTDEDMCDGVQQCREGFDELACPSPRNPYILPTVVSLAAVLVIVIVMCVLYKLCLYRFSSTRVNTDQSTSCSTIFLKKQTSETRLDIAQLEPSSDKSSEECGGEVAASREQCVQYPSQDEEEENTGDEESVSSSTHWVSTTI